MHSWEVTICHPDGTTEPPQTIEADTAGEVLTQTMPLLPQGDSVKIVQIT
jgi:hypothetical protein